MIKSLPYQIAYPTRLQVLLAALVVSVIGAMVAGSLLYGVVVAAMLMTIIATGAVVVVGLFPELFRSRD